MSKIEFLGMLVLCLSSLIGLFVMLFKPLNDNTKAMSTLVSRIDRITEKMDERDEEYEDEIAKYKVEKPSYIDEDEENTHPELDSVFNDGV